MRRPKFIARQGRRPSGLLGRVIAQIMARESAAENRIALDLLDLQTGNAVLEIGFGHGRLIAELAKRCPQGSITGLDHSPDMVRMASGLNLAAISSGIVRLDLGDSRSLPYESQTFDRIVSIHTVYFWGQPDDHLREIRRVLKPGGRFVLGYRPDSENVRGAFPASIYTFRSAEQVRELMEVAGFTPIKLVSPGAASRGVIYSLASCV